MATLCVSTHSRPKAAGLSLTPYIESLMFQHTAARRRLVLSLFYPLKNSTVSTHSRPKAAGLAEKSTFQRIFGFNTQPPEGGWRRPRDSARMRDRFNTQPPEGGWIPNEIAAIQIDMFQHTAARRRLAVPNKNFRV